MMPIDDLDDLRRFMERLAADMPPAVADRLRLRAPGISDAERRRLEADLPGLPGSYLDCAQRFALESTELGVLQLRPGSLGGRTLAERLVAANGPTNPLHAALQERHLFEVAVIESDPVCVVSDRAADAGQVVWMDIESGGDPVVSPLAPDFATFMIVAGRLYQASLADGVAELVLVGLDLDARSVETWRDVASMVL